MSAEHFIEPSASPEETAAIVAALERFMRATAPVLAPPADEDPWRRSAVVEAVERAPEAFGRDPWINT